MGSSTATGTGPGSGDDLVGSIYDAALDEARWAALGQELARRLDAPSAVLHLRDADGRASLLFATPNMVPRSTQLQQLAGYWRRSENDLYVRAASTAGLGKVLTGHDYFAAGVLENSPFYNEWARHLGVFHIVGSLVAIGDGQVASIAVHRPRGDRRFDVAQVQGFAHLLPHFVRALQIRSRLGRQTLEAAAFLDLADRHGTVVIAVDAQARLLHASPGGERLLRQGDGLALAAGRVRCAGARQALELSHQIARAAQVAARGCAPADTPPAKQLVIERGVRLPLTVVVAPLRTEDRWMHVPAAVLLVRDPEQASAATSCLRELFGLTAAEALVTARLAEGRSVEQIASEHGVGITTVRTQVRRALEKTGTRRQGELVSLVWRSAAVFAPVATRH